TCNKCGANCDSGEIVGNRCPECWEQERQMRAQSEHAFRVMTSPFYQMDLMEAFPEGADG
ncbi:MAG: hypothetical protein NC429_17385, partial [Lachnospiraceae bacterium]|nr:hypothetical protein [Lachnospiraceae bacterium]